MLHKVALAKKSNKQLRDKYENYTNINWQIKLLKK